MTCSRRGRFVVPRPMHRRPDQGGGRRGTGRASGCAWPASRAPMGRWGPCLREPWAWHRGGGNDPPSAPRHRRALVGGKQPRPRAAFPLRTDPPGLHVGGGGLGRGRLGGRKAGVRLGSFHIHLIILRFNPLIPFKTFTEECRGNLVAWVSYRRGGYGSVASWSNTIEFNETSQENDKP